MVTALVPFGGESPRFENAAGNSRGGRSCAQLKQPGSVMEFMAPWRA
jgi:hypothetical protein